MLSNESQHITLCEIIQPKPYLTDKQQLFEAHSEEYKTIPSRIIKQFEPIAITFNKIVVSPQAITIQGTDDGSFDKIRQQMVDKLPLPEETRTPPDVIHSTIARFSQRIDLKGVEEIIAKYRFEQREIVNAFLLTHCTIPPLGEFEIQQTFPLSNFYN